VIHDEPADEGRRHTVVAVLSMVGDVLDKLREDALRECCRVLG
jgi:hypothetical protein